MAGSNPLRAVCGLILLASLAGHCGAWAAESAAAELPPLRWAADAEGGAPYIFKDPNNPDQYVGFEVDLAKALERELGRRIEFVQYDFRVVTSGLERGDFDFAMNGIEATPDRRAALRLSRPYYVYSLQLVVRRDEERFASLEDCQRLGAVVGTLEDTAAQRLLNQMDIPTKIYVNQTEPYLDLELDRIDAVLLDLPIALYYAKPNPRLKFVGAPLAAGYYVIAFRKDQQALAEQFDAALERLLESGRLREIYQEWHLWNADQEMLLGRGQPGDVLGESRRLWTLGRYLPTLLKGAEVTVVITVLSMMLAMALALPVAVGRLYGPAPLRLAATGYVEFFRGIPVLLLLYFLYYGLPVVAEYYGLPVSLKLQPLHAAILGFGLNYAAYEAEIYRAGISSIPLGQWEAAASLGMSRWLTFRRIILPQAIRVILPPTTNDFVALFKDTSIVSIVAVEELTKQYQMLAKSSLKYLEIGLVTAVLYLVMSVPLGYLSRYLEKRWGKGHG
jgi:polar amino acid transport system substrate-binding protein